MNQTLRNALVCGAIGMLIGFATKEYVPWWLWLTILSVVLAVEAVLLVRDYFWQRQAERNKADWQRHVDALAKRNG